MDKAPRDTALPDCEWLTIDELARWLRLPRSTTYDLVRRREIPAVKLGRHIRIPREHVLALKN